MKISARDVRINGAINDILGMATKADVNIIEVQCTPTVLLKCARGICDALDFMALPFASDYITDAVITKHGDVECIYPKAAPAPIDGIDDSLPF